MRVRVRVSIRASVRLSVRIKKTFFKGKSKRSKTIIIAKSKLSEVGNKIF